MDQLLKKLVLISPEQKSAQVGAIFSELGFELTCEYDKDQPAKYAYIVDDYLPEIRFLPRIQTQEHILKKCLPDVRGFFDCSKVESPAVKKLIAAQLSFEGNFDIIDHYSADFKNVYSIKIHDYLNIGYFIDTIVVEAYKGQFPIGEIRNFLNHALPYSLKKMEKMGDYAPVDVSFSYSEEGFALQVALNCLSADVNQDLMPSAGLFHQLKDNCNFIDITHFKKRDRFILSSVWLKDEHLRNFKSYFYTEVNAKAGNDASLITVIDENEKDVNFANKESSAEAAFKVNGQFNIMDEFQRILGSKGPEDFSIARIAGSKTEDEWKQIIPEVTQKLTEEITKIRARGDEVKVEDVVRIISEEISDSDINAVKTFVKNILQETEQGLQLKASPPLSSAHQEKLESQILRMKRIIEQMKAEIIRLRDEVKKAHIDDSQAMVGEQTEEVLKLKKTLANALENVRYKDKVVQKLRADMEQISAAKDIKIEYLESKIADLKADFVQSREFANEEKLEVLQAENKSLLARLELANRKINIISTNMDKHDSGQNAKKDKEIANLKSSVQMAQAIIDKLNKERDEIESKLNEEREKFSKVREEKSTSDLAIKAVAEKDKQLIAILQEKKSLEEKAKLQSIELKKLEQKLKFTTAQLDEAQKRKNPQSSQTGAKSNDIYIKQLEHANVKLAEVSSDLADKKRELLKLKQENSMLATKTIELERKLGILDKKAS